MTRGYTGARSRGDLDWSRTSLQPTGEERPGCRSVATLADQDLDYLPVLVDRAVEVGPLAGDLDVGFIDKPSIPRRVPSRASRVNEFGREGLHPPVDRDVVDLDATFGEKFLDVAVGQVIAQVPAHRGSDHFAREAVAGRCG